MAPLTETGDVRPIESVRGLLSDAVNYAGFRLSNLLLHPWSLRLLGVWIRLRRTVHPERFTDADPFKTIAIDPDRITYQCFDLRRPTPVVRVSMDWGVIRGGEWELTPFEENDRYRLFVSRYVDGKSWSELEYPEASGAQRDNLFEAMKRDGYRSRSEIERTADPDPMLTSAYRRTGVRTRRDVEVSVGIYRDGEFVFAGNGKNRLSMAKILGIDEIPVQVRVRHPEWQAVRDEMRAANSLDALSERALGFRSHPDVQDVVPDG